MTDESKEFIYTFTELEQEKINNARLSDDLQLLKHLVDIGFSTTNAIFLFLDLKKNRTLSQSLKNLLDRYDITIESPASDDMPQGQRLSSSSH